MGHLACLQTLLLGPLYKNHIAILTSLLLHAWSMFLITSVTGAIKTYYKTLKAKSKRVLTCVRKEGLPQVANKQEESVITARRNQRCHNVSYQNQTP